MKGGAGRTRVVPDAEGQGVGRFVAFLRDEARDTLHIWRDRVRQRRELAQWTDRDLHDVGLSWSDIALEVRKPFWRA